MFDRTVEFSLKMYKYTTKIIEKWKVVSLASSRGRIGYIVAVASLVSNWVLVEILLLVIKHVELKFIEHIELEHSKIDVGTDVELELETEQHTECMKSQSVSNSLLYILQTQVSQ